MRHLPIPSIIFKMLKEASTRQKQVLHVGYYYLALGLKAKVFFLLLLKAKVDITLSSLY